jgi:hypothetical protein
MESFDVQVGYYINENTKGGLIIRCYIPTAKMTKQNLKMPNMNSIVMVTGLMIGYIVDTKEPAILINNIQRLGFGSSSAASPFKLKTTTGSPQAKMPKGKWDFATASSRSAGPSTVQRNRMERSISPTPASTKPQLSTQLSTPLSPQMTTRKGKGRAVAAKRNKSPSPSDQLREN